jgi:hypothetical protein
MLSGFGSRFAISLDLTQVQKIQQTKDKHRLERIIKEKNISHVLPV